VRPGLYRFRLEGQLQNGEWAFITKGEYEVKPPLVTEIVDSRFENWRRIALIVALRVKVTNTTRAKIRLSSIGFTYDPEGLPGLGTTLSTDESPRTRPRTARPPRPPALRHPARQLRDGAARRIHHGMGSGDDEPQGRGRHSELHCRDQG
jgi:hypothetical protein